MHARGARPYNFVTRVDTWHAPGATHSARGTICAADAAYLIEKVANMPPARLPPKWPGLESARQKAIELARAAGLYDYQQEGAAFLAERDYAILADAPGLGKTGQAIVAAEARMCLGASPSPNTPAVLVVCPSIAKRHWQQEIRKWSGSDAGILQGMTPGPLPETRYIIANYDILYGLRRRNETGVLQNSAEHPGWASALTNQFVIAIFDEAHTLRGRDSRRTRVVRDMLRNVVAVWLLTATPITNHVKDLWSLVDIASGGLWGPYWPWAKKYCGARQGQYGWVDTDSDCLPELRFRSSFFISGRSKESVSLQLPPKRRELYRVDIEALAKASPETNKTPLPKHRAVARALRATARAKRAVAIEQVREAVEAKQKVVVFTYTREQCEEIANGVKKFCPTATFCTHGEQIAETRFALAESFRAAPAPAVFVATMDSVGVSISLVGCDLELFADLDYQPWKLVQAEGRGHRHGSTSPVLVRYLIGVGTIDEEIAESVIKKLNEIEETLGKEADNDGIARMLSADKEGEQQIVDRLFSKLVAWGQEAS